MPPRKPHIGGIVVAVLLACLYAQQHLVDRGGIPIHAIGVSDVRAHSESRLMYPGANAMAEQASAQNAGTLLGIQFGTIVPGQANATSQTPVRESAVIVWYDHWLSAHRWTMVSDRGPASAGGIGFDRRIAFRRGDRENYLLLVDAFPGGTLIHTTYRIEPFTIVRVFA